MLKKMMKEKHFCALDIGPQKLKACLIKPSNEHDVELLGAYETRTYGFAESGVSDLNEFSECIFNTVNELSKRTGVKLKEIHLGVDGNIVSVRKTSTAIPLVDSGTKVIGSKDVHRLNKQARLLAVKMEEEVLHDLPQSYVIDDQSSIHNPLGLYGRTLGVDSLIILAEVNRVRNIIKAVNQAGFDVGKIHFSSLLSSRTILLDQEKERGVLLIDIGSNVTSLLIFKSGHLQYVSKIPMGGNHFSKEIARQLNLPFDLAEEIKKSYAVAFKTDNYSDEEILVKRESNYVPIKRALIHQAVESKTLELVDYIREGVLESELSDQLNTGVVLTGGGALLSGLAERIEQDLNLKARLGKVDLFSQDSFNNAATFSAVLGIAYQGLDTMLGYSVIENGHVHWSRRMADKIKEMYQEYF